MADIFTDVGETLVADYVDGTSSAPTNCAPTNWYVAWGTGAGTAAKGDTTLFTEAAEARVIVTESQPAGNQNRFVGTITSAGAQTITNAGIFDASSVGNMLLKSDFTGIVLAASDSIQFTFDLTWS
jgi:hypothetical protein